MKMRFKPALRIRLLATGVSLTAFVAIVLGFIQESQNFAPDQSVKLSGTNMALPPQVLVTQEPIIPVDTASTPPQATSTSASPRPSSSSTSPSTITVPSAMPTNSAAPVVNPSPNFTNGVEPASPAIPVPPDVDQPLPEESVAVYTCMSPGGSTREPYGNLCPSKWGYFLTQV